MIDKPEPRIDEQDMPWCDKACSSLVQGSDSRPGEYYTCQGGSIDCEPGTLCQPKVQAMAEEIKKLREDAMSVIIDETKLLRLHYEPQDGLEVVSAGPIWRILAESIGAECDELGAENFLERTLDIRCAGGLHSFIITIQRQLDKKTPAQIVMELKGKLEQHEAIVADRDKEVAELRSAIKSHNARVKSNCERRCRVHQEVGRHHPMECPLEYEIDVKAEAVKEE